MNTPAPIHIQRLFSTVIYTTWQATCSPDDVTVAFDQLATLLDASRYPQHIVLDMSAKPLIPLDQTIADVLNLNYHRRVAAWYIIGTGACASSMADVLQKVCTNKPAYHYADSSTLWNTDIASSGVNRSYIEESVVPCRA